MEKLHEMGLTVNNIYDIYKNNKEAMMKVFN